MKAYCDGFAKVKGTVPAIAAYVKSHPLRGVVAKDPSTLVFKLVSPAPDFLNILAMGFCSARPIEYMKYVPDGAQMRQHMLSDGPYAITKYVPTKSMTLERNPAWNASSDPLRHAYVDSIEITEGLSSDERAAAARGGHRRHGVGHPAADPGSAAPDLGRRQAADPRPLRAPTPSPPATTSR